MIFPLLQIIPLKCLNISADALPPKSQVIDLKLQLAPFRDQEGPVLQEVKGEVGEVGGKGVRLGLLEA